MSSWHTVKQRIELALEKVKATPVLDSAAKTALKCVPYVGEFLLNLYDSTGGSEEERSKKILEILDRLENFHAQQFKQLTMMLSDNRETLSRDAKALDNILVMANETLDYLKRIEEGQLDLRESTEQVKIILNDMNRDLQELNQATNRFDFEIAAERLVFLVKILGLLEQSYEIFSYQNNLAVQLTNKMRSRGHKIAGGRGYDDILRELHFSMNAEEEQIFSSIRAITDDMRGINVKVKGLLNSNNDYFDLLPELRNLYEHLSWWNAKYELLRDDPDMCLVYVGPRQKKPFPRGIENVLAEEIDQLVKETALDVPAEQGK
jgi:hypothetical protein